MLTNINMTKKYKILLNQQTKSRMKLTSNLIHALIYFYPNGMSNKSKTGYAASDVQIDILSPHFQENGECVQIIWQCGNKTKKQHCALSRYIKPDNKHALGFHTLFTTKYIKQMKEIIKVTVKINKSCFKSNPCVSIQKQSNNKRKFIQTKLNDYQFYATPNKKIKLSKLKSNDWKYHWKMQPNVMTQIVNKISNNLNTDNLFDIIPTIDCFCTNKNNQAYCREKITETDNFFSKQYQCTSFWKNHVAWCNPPPVKSIIISTMNKFEKRKMTGFVCIAYWNTCNWRKERWWRQCKEKCKTYTTINEGIPFHEMLVLFFDYKN